MSTAPAAILSPLLLLLLPLILLLFLSSTTASSDMTTVVYSTCSDPNFLPNSPYQINLASLLSSLSASAGFSLYSKFTSAAAQSSPPVSGLFQCRGDLSIPDCSSCVRSSVHQLSSLCPSATSASIQLRGCFLFYGNNTFIGRLDTTLRYKTCSTGGNGGGQQFLAAREAAFASLCLAPITGSSFRVATAGPVQAEAQCTGDISLRDCNDCVAAAASRVVESCGGAAAGEAYLGKCYIWYSGGGVVPRIQGGGSEGPGGDDNDETGKTFAIMIGVIAIIAFIVLCLFYMRRKLKALGKH